MSPRSVHVIGRGIVGLSTAFSLQKRGVNVTLVGPAAKAGSATRAAAGTSTLKGNIQATSAFFALKLRGHAGLEPWLEALERASGRHIARDFSGAYEPFYNQKEYVHQRQRIFHRQFTGCFSLKVHTPGRIAQRFSSEGAFPRQCQGAFHYFKDGWYDPVACLEALEQALVLGGASFLEGEVQRISPREGGQTIHTTAGACLAEETVLAAGIFSDEILRQSGLSAPSQEAVEGETVLASAPGLRDVVLKMGKMNLVVHRGVLRVGSSSRRQADIDLCAPSADAVASLAALAEVQLGAGSAFSTLWGIRGRFKDHTPGIGTLYWSETSQRLWLATGFYKNGLQLAPLFTEALAALMTLAPNLSTKLSTAFPQPLTSFLV